MGVGNIQRHLRPESVIGEDEQFVGGRRRQGIVGRPDDECTELSFGDLISRTMVEMLMIPIRPGGAGLDREHVIVRPAGRYRVERATVLAGRQVDPMPVNC